MVKQEHNRIADMACDSSQMITEHPLPSALVVFGVGIGVGLVVSQLLAEPIARYVAPEPTGTERFRRQLMDALRGFVPDSMM